MSLTKNKNFGAPIGGSNPTKDESQNKRVVDIILDINHPKYIGPDSIGIIFFTDEKSQEITSEIYSLPTARPINRNNFSPPLIGEIVPVIQSITNEYYTDLGGNPTNVINYYYPSLNIHNNTTNNALPQAFNKKNQTNILEGSNNSDFLFRKEFISPRREIADRELDNYLRDLGYTSGRSDSRAPRYSLFQRATGEYVFRLDESEENKIKLGEYHKENPNQR